MTTKKPAIRTGKTNNPHDIELDIRDHHTIDEEGWVNVYGSNQKPYSYQYSGGDPRPGSKKKGNGDVTYHAKHGVGKIKISLVACRDRYALIGDDCVGFVGDTQAQLSVSGKSRRQRVIKDKCTKEIAAYYMVAVTDIAEGNATIPCDPRVINRPPAMA